MTEFQRHPLSIEYINPSLVAFHRENIGPSRTSIILVYKIDNSNHLLPLYHFDVSTRALGPYILKLADLASALLVNQESGRFATMDDSHTPDASLLQGREPCDNMWSVILIKRDYSVPKEHRDSEIPIKVLSEVKVEIVTLCKLEEGSIVCRSMDHMPPVSRNRKVVREDGKSIDIEMCAVQLKRRGHIFHSK